MFRLGRSVDALLRVFVLIYTLKFFCRIQFTDNTCCKCGQETENVTHECSLYATKGRKSICCAQPAKREMRSRPETSLNASEVNALYGSTYPRLDVSFV